MDPKDVERMIARYTALFAQYGMRPYQPANGDALFSTNHNVVWCACAAELPGSSVRYPYLSFEALGDRILNYAIRWMPGGKIETGPGVLVVGEDGGSWYECIELFLNRLREDGTLERMGKASVLERATVVSDTTTRIDDVQAFGFELESLLERYRFQSHRTIVLVADEDAQEKP